MHMKNIWLYLRGNLNILLTEARVIFAPDYIIFKRKKISLDKFTSLLN